MSRWEPVVENPNYIVSEDGRVRRVGSEKDHSIYYDKDGYSLIHLYKNGKCQNMRLHRIVANAFIPNPENKPEVNHKDTDKRNNSVSNLEWVTKKENCEHAWVTGCARPSYGMLGKKNPNAGRKGKPFKIVETGEIFNTLKECEEAIGGNGKHINDCLRGRQSTHRGYHFEYI